MSAAIISYKLPDGVYRLEFESREVRSDRPYISDIFVSVVDGPLKGRMISEVLRFDQCPFGAHGRADREKTKQYGRIFGIGEDAGDPEDFLFYPFLAEVIDGVVVAAGVNRLDPLPAACTRPRRIVCERGAWEFETLDRQAA